MSRPNRLRSLLQACILVMLAVTAFQLATPQKAEAQLPSLPVPCGLIPDGTVEDVCDAASDPVGTGIDAGTGLVETVTGAKLPGIPKPKDLIKDAAASAANAIVAPILKEITKAEAAAVSAVLKEEAKFVNSSTTPTLTAKWFIVQYQVILGMAVFLAIAMFYMRTGLAVKDSNPVEMGNAFFAFFVFFIVGMLLPILVGAIVKVTDGVIAPGFMDIAGKSANETMKNMDVNFNKEISGTNNVVVPILLPLIFLFFGLIGGVINELMLLFRMGMLYVVTGGAALALALMVGGRIGWSTFQKVMWVLVALILFKVAMAFILVIGIQLFNAHEGVQSVLLGSVILLMSPILTWMFYQRVSGHTIAFLPGGASRLGSLANKLRG